MATLEYWVQTGNDGAVHQSIFGSSLPAGGGSGTALSPYATWAQVNTKLEEAGHGTDDLIINMHPACIFLTDGTNWLKTFQNFGNGTKWQSVTIQLWQEVIDAQPLYADWRPTIMTAQPITVWTQGSVSGGVWTAGTGDVYRGACKAQFATWLYFGCWAGVDMKDCRISAPATVPRYCASLNELTDEGDYELTVNSGSDLYIYVKTGQVGVNPTARWGNSFVYVGAGSGGLGSPGLQFQYGKNFVWSDLQINGGYLKVYTGDADGLLIENCGFPRHTGRMRAGKGCEITTNVSSYQASKIRNLDMSDIRLNAQVATKGVKGATSPINGGMDGVTTSGRVDGISLNNPTVSGFSHAQLMVNPVSFKDKATATSAVDTFNPLPFFVDGANDFPGFYGRRGFWVTVSGGVGTATLQSGPTSTGPWTDVTTFPVGTSQAYNDGGSASIYYRLGVKAADWSSGSITCTITGLAYPRGMTVDVTSDDPTVGILTGAPSVAPADSPNSFRGIGCYAANTRFGPLKIRNTTDMTQISGQVTVNGMNWDSSNIPWSNVNDDDNNIGQNVAWGVPADVLIGNDTAFAPKIPVQDLRGYGLKHDINGCHAGHWDFNISADELLLRGCLVRDSGAARYSIDTNSANSGYTRRKVPYCAWTNNSTGGIPQKIQDGFFIPGAGSEGFATKKQNGFTAAANATETNFPVISVSDAGAVPWGGGRVSGNLSGVESDFGFDTNLVYTGARKTPNQTSSSRHRGY